MSEARQLRAADLAEGMRIRFDVRGETKTGVVQQVRDFHGKLRFDVQTGDNTFMARSYEADDLVTVLDGDEA
jgi:hypothetical protein